MLKSLVCAKTKLSHMEKTVYNPSCLRYCSELCGVRCQDRCNKGHSECKNGVLPEKFLYCPSAGPAIGDMKIGFVTYETKEVNTYGKGKPYTRMEKIVTDYSFEEYKALLRKEFLSYGEHTLSSWLLRATKLEAFAPSEMRSSTLTITSDFGEAIQIVGKNETSDQFYHRPEVRLKTNEDLCLRKNVYFLKVCLFGSVSEMTYLDDKGCYQNYRMSHILTSDYKY